MELDASFTCLILDRGMRCSSCFYLHLHLYLHIHLCADIIYVTILGLPDTSPRQVQLIQPARMRDLELAGQDSESSYESHLATTAAVQQTVKPSRQRTTNSSNLVTPTSQLSYKAMSARADPLPSSLALQKDRALSKNSGKFSPHDHAHHSSDGKRQAKPQMNQRTPFRSGSNQKSTSRASVSGSKKHK